MSFVLASIPYGLATQLFFYILGGSPVVIIWGWLAVSITTVCVALSLAEITSIYLTASSKCFGFTVGSLKWAVYEIFLQRANGKYTGVCY